MTLRLTMPSIRGSIAWHDGWLSSRPAPPTIPQDPAYLAEGVDQAAEYDVGRPAEPGFVDEGQAGDGQGDEREGCDAVHQQVSEWGENGEMVKKAPSRP